MAENGQHTVRVTPDDEDANARQFRESRVEAERVYHPETGDVLLNPRTLAPILSVRPEHDLTHELRAAERKVRKARKHLEAADAEYQRAVADAEKADEIWQFVLADYVAKDAQVSDADRERVREIREARGL